MFGLAHGFEEWPARYALKSMVAAVGLVFVGALVDLEFLRLAGYIAAFVSVALHLYQVWQIYRVRVRKEFDIWYASVLFAYLFLVVAFVLGAIYILSGATYNVALLGGFWFLLLFFAFLINAHLYKIIPFLVWFHRYSDKVGKERVPMLHEMYPKKAAWFEFWLSGVGGVLVGAALLAGSSDLFKAGASFLVAGAIFLVLSIKWMLEYGRENG
jgi:hypothetical protein